MAEKKIEVRPFAPGLDKVGGGSVWSGGQIGDCRSSTDCASWSHRSRLHHLNAAKPSASCHSQDLDSSVCFRIDCVAISTLIQAVRPKQESSSIVSWNGNGRKQVIGAFNSNGMPVVVPPSQAPGPSNGSAPMSATSQGTCSMWRGMVMGGSERLAPFDAIAAP